jgi:iron(II)-dependent oxidoreductase
MLLAALDVTAQEDKKVPAEPRFVVLDPAALAAAREGMVLVPAGEFKIGSSDDDSWAERDEMPQRVVRLPDFLIDQLEVSNIEYKRFIDATGWPAPEAWKDMTYREGTEFIPVTGVTWWDAMAYARWVGKRLPSEVEWEKAARGDDGRRFPWGNKFSADRGNNGTTPLPVGSKPEGASPYGLVDMAGNAAEWTATPYAPYPALEAVLPTEFGGASGAIAPAKKTESPTRSVPEIDPTDPRLAFFTREELADVRPRVYRGGSYNSYAQFLRCANREKEDPGAHWPNLGFRCAADVDSAGAKP